MTEELDRSMLLDMWVVSDAEFHWAAEIETLVCYTQLEAEAIADWQNAGVVVHPNHKDDPLRYCAQPLHSWYKDWRESHDSNLRQHMAWTQLRNEYLEGRDDIRFAWMVLWIAAGVVVGGFMVKIFL